MQVIGLVATQWLKLADRSDEGIFDPDCIELSQLHSDAVDFPKARFIRSTDNALYIDVIYTVWYASTSGEDSEAKIPGECACIRCDAVTTGAHLRVYSPTGAPPRQ